MIAQPRVPWNRELARNPPFVDGNKRLAFLAMALVLETDGLAFKAAEDQATAILPALAAGQVFQAEVATWIAETCVPAG